MRILHHGLGLCTPTAYKDVARTIVHHTRAPLDVVIPDHSNCAVVLGAGKDEALRWRLRAILDPLLRAPASIHRGSG